MILFESFAVAAARIGKSPEKKSTRTERIAFHSYYTVKLNREIFLERLGLTAFDNNPDHSYTCTWKGSSGQSVHKIRKKTPKGNLFR